jgi:hypothetical protein
LARIKAHNLSERSAKGSSKHAAGIIRIDRKLSFKLELEFKISYIETLKHLKSKKAPPSFRIGGAKCKAYVRNGRAFHHPERVNDNAETKGKLLLSF